MNRNLSDLSIKEVDTAIRALAAESPDYVYNPSAKEQGCYYHKGVRGGPESKGCIFGQAFQRLGVDMSTVAGDSINRLWLDTHDAPPHSLGEACPEEWLEVQGVQDNGGTWSAAIQHLK